MKSVMRRYNSDEQPPRSLASFCSRFFLKSSESYDEYIKQYFLNQQIRYVYSVVLRHFLFEVFPFHSKVYTLHAGQGLLGVAVHNNNGGWSVGRG